MEEDKNYINMIHGDLARASQVQSGMPENVGVMNIKTANRTILEASQKPTPRSLWDCFWYEGELSCLFADSNVGKSILAVQIADRIAQTDNVLYLDFELSEKQFQLRYTNEHGNLYSFPERTADDPAQQSQEEIRVVPPRPGTYSQTLLGLSHHLERPCRKQTPVQLL